MRLFVLAFVLLSATAAFSQSPPAAPAEMEKYWMVFLDRAPNAPELAPEQAAEVQKGHLAHLGKMWEEGYALVAGPFAAPPDERTRGIVLFRGDLEQAEVLRLSSEDPAVKAGRLAPRVLAWYCGKGVISFTPAAEWKAAHPQAAQ